MTIKKKLTAVILTNFLSILVLGGMSAIGVHKIHERIDEVIKMPIPSILQLNNMTEVFLLSMASATSYQSHGLVEDKNDYYIHSDKFRQSMAEIKSMLGYGTSDIPEEDIQIIDAISEKFDALDRAIRNGLEQPEKMEREGQSHSVSFFKQGNEVIVLLRQYRDMEKNEIETSHEEIENIIERVTVVLVFAISAIIAISASMSAFIARSILSPLRLLRDAAEKLGEGDMDSRVETDSRDELGMLANSFNLMAENVRGAHEILEKKVKERTLELEKAKSGLEETVALRTAELEKAKSELEQTVFDRTEEIRSKLAQLEKMNAAMVGRELKMMDMKREIEALRTRVEGARGVDSEA